jgi:LuxR family quorum sensing-dependent transcriptional regulator
MARECHQDGLSLASAFDTHILRIRLPPDWLSFSGTGQFADSEFSRSFFELGIETWLCNLINGWPYISKSRLNQGAVMGGDFSEALQACATVEDVRSYFKNQIVAYGYTASACGAFLPADKGPEPHFYFLDWPAEWLALYSQRNFVANDYMVAEGRRRIAPFTWLEAKAGRVLTDAEQEIWDATVQWGWSDGLSVPIHGPGGYFGLIAMAGQQQPMPPSLRNRLHMLAFLTHERCRALAKFPVVEDPKAALSSRELECMRWVGAGKTDWEIGTIMSLSPTTVKSHVDQARKKLGARTRPQAVARLVFSGLM